MLLHGETRQSARRERWALLAAADGDQAALVLAYQRLAWATCLLVDQRSCGSVGSKSPLDYLPLDAMEQIAEYQHSFVLPCHPSAPSMMLPRSVLCQVGFRCDAQDIHGDWYTAYVAAVDEPSTRVLIHFVGWSEKFREWFNLDEQERLMESGHSCRIAPLGRFTKRAKERRWWLAHDRWALTDSQPWAMPTSAPSTSIWTRDTEQIRAFDIRLLPACKVCNQAVDAENTVLCEGCEDSIRHTYCYAPPMEAPPEGIWYCVDCRARAGMPVAQETDDHAAAAAMAHAADDSFGGLVWLPNCRAHMGGDDSSSNTRPFGWVMKRDVHM
jgi:hypothetical protein